MAVPSLVALKVVAEHSERGGPLVAFLSPRAAKRFKPRFAKMDPSARVKKTPIAVRS